MATRVPPFYLAGYFFRARPPAFPLSRRLGKHLSLFFVGAPLSLRKIIMREKTLFSLLRFYIVAAILAPPPRMVKFPGFEVRLFRAVFQIFRQGFC